MNSNSYLTVDTKQSSTGTYYNKLSNYYYRGYTTDGTYTRVTNATYYRGYYGYTTYSISYYLYKSSLTYRVTVSAPSCKAELYMTGGNGIFDFDTYQTTITKISYTIPYSTTVYAPIVNSSGSVIKYYWYTGYTNAYGSIGPTIYGFRENCNCVYNHTYNHTYGIKYYYYYFYTTVNGPMFEQGYTSTPSSSYSRYYGYYYYTYANYVRYYGYYYYYTGPFTDTTYFYNRSYIKV